MIQELLYTSAPQGLKPGSRGFCTVLCTQGMAAPVVEALEGLSGYKQIYMPGDPDVDRNPVGWSHLMCTIAGRRVSVLSRIANYGVDYTQRTNKLAHHVLLDAGDRIPAGPARLLSQPGFMLTRFEGEPRLIPPGRKAPALDAAPAPCRAWEAATGDAGWGGVLAESFLKDPSRLVYLTFTPGFDVLPLIAESIALIPPERRWEVTFSTYFTTLPGSAVCQWRCVVAGSQEANESRRHVQALRIALGEPLPAPAESPWVEFARTGVKPDTGRSQHSPAPESSDSRAAAASALDRGETYRLTKPAAPPPPAPATWSPGAPVPPVPSPRKFVWPVLLSLLVVALLVGTAAVVLVMKGGPSAGTDPPTVANADAKPASTPPEAAPPSANAAAPTKPRRGFGSDAAEEAAETPAGASDPQSNQQPDEPKVSDSNQTGRTEAGNDGSRDIGSASTHSSSGNGPGMSESAQIAGADGGSRPIESAPRPAATPVVFQELPAAAVKGTPDDSVWREVPLSEELPIPPEKVQLGLWAPTDYPDEVSMVLVLQATESSKVYVARLINKAGFGSDIELATIRIAPSEGNAQHTELWFQWLPGGVRNLDALRYCVIGVAREDGVMLRWIALHKELGRISLGAEDDMARWRYEAIKLEAPLSKWKLWGRIVDFRLRAGDRIVEVERPDDPLSLLPDSKSKDISLRFNPQHAMEEVETGDWAEVKPQDLPVVEVGLESGQQTVVKIRKMNQRVIDGLKEPYVKAGQSRINRLNERERYGRNPLASDYLADNVGAPLDGVRSAVEKESPPDNVKKEKEDLDKWEEGRTDRLRAINDCDSQLRKDGAVVRQFQKDCRNAVVNSFVLSRSLRECKADGSGRVGELLLINVENGQDQPLQFRLLDAGGPAK